MSLFGHVNFSLSVIILPLRLTGTYRVLCSSCRLYSLHCLSQLCYGAELVVLSFSCTDHWSRYPTQYSQWENETTRYAVSYCWQTSFIIWTHLSPTGEHACFAGTSTVNRSPHRHSSRCWQAACYICRLYFYILWYILYIYSHCYDDLQHSLIFKLKTDTTGNLENKTIENSSVPD